VITGNAVPDHATIARFVVRHEAALAELFGEVLKLCDRAGLVKPGVIAIDGSRLAGNANRNRSHGFEQIAREFLAEAKATDEAEDQRLGEARGDELPEQLRTAEGRREFFRRARQEHQQRGLNAEAPKGAQGDTDDLEAEAEALSELLRTSPHSQAPNRISNVSSSDVATPATMRRAALTKRSSRTKSASSAVATSSPSCVQALELSGHQLVLVGRPGKHSALGGQQLVWGK
jgi:hypothetical protein